MRKSDLKDGMIVELRNGKRYMFISELNLFVGEKLGVDVAWYNDGFSIDGNDFKGYSIDKVFKPIKNGSFSEILSNSKELIWERKGVEKLTQEQYDKLKALLTVGYNWVAKDEDGEIYAYDSKPIRGVICWFHVDNENCIKLKNFELSFIDRKEDAPRSIVDLLKLEVK